jgi:broad specificity phosphatase PhoE
MASPIRLFLIRHAEVDARYHRVFGGRIDMDLSPLGHEQARALAVYLQKFPFHAIYASPMKRVQQTLAQLRENATVEPLILEQLREVDFGVWTGLSWEQVAAEFRTDVFQWLQHLEDGLIAQAEPIGQFKDRIQTCVQSILESRAGQSVAIICHGGVIRMILSILLDLPFKKMAAFDIEYASVTIIDCLPNKIEVELLNFTPWRDQS